MQRVRRRAAGSSPTRCGPHHQAQRPRRVRSQRVAPCCSRFQPACLPAGQSASLPARARSEHGRSCQPDQQQRPYKCARAVNASRRAADPAALSAGLQPCSLARQPARARARHARTSRSSDPERGSVAAASLPYYNLRHLLPSVARRGPCLQQASPGLPGARVSQFRCSAAAAAASGPPLLCCRRRGPRLSRQEVANSGSCSSNRVSLRQRRCPQRPTAAHSGLQRPRRQRRAANGAPRKHAVEGARVA
jgi:hypothetical protein